MTTKTIADPDTIGRQLPSINPNQSDNALNPRSLNTRYLAPGSDSSEVSVEGSAKVWPIRSAPRISATDVNIPTSMSEVSNILSRRTVEGALRAYAGVKPSGHKLNSIFDALMGHASGMHHC